MKNSRFLSGAFSLLLVISTQTIALTEKEAILIGLEKNSDLELSRIRYAQDSLELENMLFNKSTVLKIESSPSINYELDSSKANITKDLNLHASKAFLGGGELNTNLNQQFNDIYSTNASISYKQPLLKGAWNNADLNFNIAIKLKDYSEAGLKFQKSILANISSVRRSYWNHFEKLSLLKIAKEELQYSMGLQKSEVRRFEIGETSELDTLSAALETIRSKQKILSLKSDIKISGNNLSLNLMIDENNISDLSNQGLAVSNLPQQADFINMVLRYDPQKNIYHLIKDRWEIIYANQKNKFLPELDLKLTYNYGLSGKNLTSENTITDNGAVINLIFSYTLPNKNLKINADKTKLSIKDNELKSIKYERELKNQVNELYFAWNQELEQLRLSQTSREIAKKQLHAAEKNLELGAVDMYTKIKAKNDYINAELQYLRRQISMKRLEIIFDEITGNVLTKFGVEIK